jgi:hypothetical protein
MNYNLISLKTSNLNKNIIIQIGKLKNTQWSFGLKSQLKWFKNNCKKNDIHNLFYIKSKLIGYTFLRIRSFSTNNHIKKKYVLFDTLIIHKDYRNKKLSDLLMLFNNTIIKQTGLFSFLICKNDLLGFYKKYNWIKLYKKQFKLKDHLSSANGMIFNTNKKKKYYFYVYK